MNFQVIHFQHVSYCNNMPANESYDESQYHIRCSKANMMHLITVIFRGNTKMLI